MNDFKDLQYKLNDYLSKINKIFNVLTDNYVAFDLSTCTLYKRERDLPIDILEYLRSDIYKKHLDLLRHNGILLKLTNLQTPALCLNAVSNNYEALQYVSIQTKEVCIEAVSINPSSIYMIRSLDKSLLEELVKVNINCLNYL